MQTTSLLNTLDNTRYNIFRWRFELSLVKKVLLALSMALLTGIMAQTRIFLPWTPVPITGQTLAVLLAGVFMGRNWGGISMIIYASLGVMGVPWFSGFSGGLAVIAGPTGGYIFGFILAAFFVGHVFDKYKNIRNFFPMLGIMILANLFLIFLPGLIQLTLWLRLVEGSSPTLGRILTMGLTPFLAGGLIKAGLAAGITKVITPKKSFN